MHSILETKMKCIHGQEIGKQVLSSISMLLDEQLNDWLPVLDKSYRSNGDYKCCRAGHLLHRRCRWMFLRQEVSKPS
jgi:hypothetical protein